MLTKYRRSDNSQKYAMMLHIKQQQCFNMGLAEMDLGLYQPMINNFLKLFEQYMLSSLQFNNQQTHHPQPNSIRQQHPYSIHLQKSKAAIKHWYQQKYPFSSSSVSQSSLDVLFCPSVVTFLSYSILSYTQPFDTVMIFTPVYASYINIVQALGRRIVPLQLKYLDGQQGQLGNFYFDARQMEDKIKSLKVRVLVLSQPHNPSGRVWDESEVKIIVQMCKKYDVMILSDQILSQISLVSKFPSFYPQLSNYNKIIIFNSLSKSYNLSSLQCGYCILPQQISKSLCKTLEVFGQRIDQLAICAIIGCLSKQGKQWLKIANGIIARNWQEMVKWAMRMKKMGVKVGKMEAGFMVYVDLQQVFDAISDMRKALHKYGVQILEIGSNYFPVKNNQIQIRICIACQQAHFDRFLDRMDKVIGQSPKTQKAKL